MRKILILLTLPVGAALLTLAFKWNHGGLLLLGLVDVFFWLFLVFFTDEPID